MTELKKITDYLDEYLNINAFRDYSQNGLQVDGKKNLTVLLPQLILKRI